MVWVEGCFWAQIGFRGSRGRRGLGLRVFLGLDRI